MSLRLEDATLVNWLSAITGVALIAIGVIVLSQSQTYGAIILSIGTSIVASAVVVGLSSRYLMRQRNVQEMFDRWGLMGLFHTRSSMNARADETLKELRHQLDLMGFGLLAFRHAQGATIEAKVRSGLEVRVLTVAPDSQCVMQRERDEGGTVGQIAKTIRDLHTWIEELKRQSPNPAKVQIRFCDGALIQSYYRQDDYIYTGPYLRGKPSQQTITYEFRRGGEGFDYWSTYFEALWNDPDFAKQRPAP
jgi:hypothetical protein